MSRAKVVLEPRDISDEELDAQRIAKESLKDTTFCCTLCQSFKLFDAIDANDMKALKKLIADERVGTIFPLKHIYGRDMTPLGYAADKNNTDAVKLLLAEITAKKKVSRKSLPTIMFKRQTSGTYSDFTYGHQVRQITASRSSKEGNEALAVRCYETNPAFDNEIMSLPHVSGATFNLIQSSLEQGTFGFEKYIYLALESGNIDLAAAAIQKAPAYTEFNQLHKEVISMKTENLSQFRSVNVNKKCLSNVGITPVHCAAVNPNPKYFKSIISLSQDPGVRDLRGRKAIHYAAASESEKTLETLLKSNYYGELDNNKFSPLMAAASAGKLKNVLLILDAMKRAENEENAAAGIAPEDVQTDLTPVAKNGDEENNDADEKKAKAKKMKMIEMKEEKKNSEEEEKKEEEEEEEEKKSRKSKGRSSISKTTKKPKKDGVTKSSSKKSRKSVQEVPVEIDEETIKKVVAVHKKENVKRESKREQERIQKRYQKEQEDAEKLAVERTQEESKRKRKLLPRSAKHTFNYAKVEAFEAEPEHIKEETKPEKKKAKSETEKDKKSHKANEKKRSHSEKHEEESDTEDKGTEEKKPNKNHKQSEEKKVKTKVAKTPVARYIKPPKTKLTATINAKSREGMNALHYACKYGHLDVIRALLENGADGTVQDSAKRTPLYICAENGYLDCVRMLVEEFHLSPLTANKQKKTPLVVSLLYGHYTVSMYLLKIGVPASDADSSGNTTIHYAVAYGRRKLLKKLIDFGADTMAVNDWKLNPFTVGVMTGHMLCSKLLITDERTTIDINTVDSEGCSTLMNLMDRTVTGETIDVVSFIIENHPKLELDDMTKKNIFHYLCCSFGSTKSHIVVQELEKLKKKLEEINDMSLKGIVPPPTVQNQKKSMDVEPTDGSNEDRMEQENDDSGEHTDSEESIDSEENEDSDEDNGCGNANLPNGFRIVSRPLPFAPNFGMYNEPESVYEIIPDGKLNPWRLNNRKEFVKSNQERVNCLTNKLDVFAFYKLIEALKEEDASRSGIAADVQPQQQGKKKKPLQRSGSALLRGTAEGAYNPANLHVPEGLPLKSEFERSVLNHRDQYGRTPLHYAAAALNLPLVRCLIEAGADPLCIDFERRNVLHYVFANPYFSLLDGILEIFDIVQPLPCLGELLRGEDCEGLNPFHRFLLTSFQNSMVVTPSDFYGFLGEITKSFEQRFSSEMEERKKSVFYSVLEKFSALDGEIVSSTVGKRVPSATMKKEYNEYNSVERPEAEKATEVAFSEKDVEEILKRLENEAYSPNDTFGLLTSRTTDFPFNASNASDNYSDDWMKIKYRSRGHFEVDGRRANKDDGIAMKEKIDAYKEKEEYGYFGKCTPLLMLVKAGVDFNDHRVKKLFKPSDLMAGDKFGNSPLIIALKSKNTPLIKFLINSNANLLTKNNQQQTVLHVCCLNKSTELFDLILSKVEPEQEKKFVNEKDSKGNTALHYAAQNRMLDFVSKLVKKGADVNALNARKRTPLHLAVMGVRSNDATQIADVEAALLKEGADVCALDDMKRMPLHYCFIDLGIANAYTFTQKDPIVFVSALIDFYRDKGKTDAPDIYGRTPLHYAAMRGSLISTIKLIAQGADVERVDEDGNTALGWSVVAHHTNLAITLLMRGVSFRTTCSKVEAQVVETPISPDDPLRTRQELKKTVTKVPLLKAILDINDQGLLYVILDNGYPLIDSVHIALRNGSVTFCLTLLEKIDLTMTSSGDPELFTIGPATLSVESLAGQTFFHSFAVGCGASGSSAPSGDCEKFVKWCVEHRIDFEKADAKGKTGMHYLMASGNRKLCELVLKATGRKCGLGVVDNDGKTPFSIFCASNPQGDSLNFIDSLLPAAKEGKESVLNTRFADDIQNYPNVNDFVLSLFEELPRKKGEKLRYAPVQITPLTCAFLNGNERLVHALLDRGADVSITISPAPKCSLVVLALLADSPLSVTLLEHTESPQSIVDEQGRTLLHWAVSPFGGYGFDNEQFIKKLLKMKLDLLAKDKHGETPYSLAVHTKNEKIVQLFADFAAKAGISLPSVSEGAAAASERLAFPPAVDSYETLFAQAINEAKAKESPKEAEPKLSKLTLANLGDKYKVLSDVTTDADGKQKVVYYDAVMVKFDIAGSIYGTNMFYKIQLLYHPKMDQYVLFNSWGRVGDEGQCQHTPQANREQAIVEFKKLYKSKTGVEFGAPQVEANSKKFRVLEPERCTVKPSNLLKDFDTKAEDAVQSSIDPAVFKFVRRISSVAKLTQELKNNGIDTELMPLGRLSLETLQKAKAKLLEIRKVSEEIKVGVKSMNHVSIALKRPRDGNESEAEDGSVSNGEDAGAELKDGAPPPKTYTSEDVSSLRNKILILSNEYFQMVPPPDYREEAVPVLDNDSIIFRELLKVDNLMYTEVASKLLIASTRIKGAMNRYDYIFSSLRVAMRPLASAESDFWLIRNYAHMTQSFRKFKVFKLEREGEAERFDGKVGNNLLLWHGTRMTNYLSILSTGLRIAPLGAEKTGSMFGEGIYFADAFAKSMGYCSQDEKGYSALLLAKVAVGKAYTPNAVDCYDYTHAPSGFDSVFGEGGTTVASWITRADGTKIPLKMKRGNSSRHGLNFNEYIVYNTSQVMLNYLVLVK